MSTGPAGAIADRARNPRPRRAGPSLSPPQPKLGYVPALDGLRAFAVGAVILLHTGLGIGAGGGIGVDVFFVISGFLITSLLLREHAVNGAIGLRRFYLRRALRLMPALTALLLGTLAFAVIAPIDLGAGFDLVRVATGALVAGLYLTDLAVSFTQVQIGPFFHTWSLAIEEHFYLLWPFVLVIALRRGWSRRNLVGLAVGAIAVVAAWRSVLYLTAGDSSHLRYSVDTQFDHLLMGCLLALLLPWLRIWAQDERARRRLQGAAVLSGLALLGLVTVDLPASALATWGFPAVYLLSACVIAHIVGGGRLGPLTPLTWRPIVYVGKLSYSLYLWHFVVFHALTASALGIPRASSIAVRLAVAAILAALSYHGVERYFLRLKDRAAA